jgi:hypothetical protein
MSLQTRYGLSPKLGKQAVKRDWRVRNRFPIGLVSGAVGMLKFSGGLPLEFVSAQTRRRQTGLMGETERFD